MGGAEDGIELGGIAEHLDGAAIPPFPLLDAKRGYSLLFACHLPPGHVWAGAVALVSIAGFVGSRASGQKETPIATRRDILFTA